MKTLFEPSRSLPICHESDIVILGGSCTGVFAAVRAARLGATVSLIEQSTILGGMATGARVNHWHHLDDALHQQPIIGGLTAEIIHRLILRGAALEIVGHKRIRYKINPAELAIELDALLQAEKNIRPFLATKFSRTLSESGRITAMVIEDASGRRAITGRFFIDASGNGDLLRRAGGEAVQHDLLQPVSYQFLASGLQKILAHNPKTLFWPEIREAALAAGLQDSNPWVDLVPGAQGVQNIFGARLNQVDASNADQLTQSYFDGRRHARVYLDLIRQHYGALAAEVALLALPHQIGIRDTWHARCHHQITSQELLNGSRFNDAIGNGTYPVDIHSPEGTLIRYLDGREEVVAKGGATIHRRWRSESKDEPSFYQIPYRCLIPQGFTNLLVAGRLLDADQAAFGGVRVMVNANQTGEAAGVAANLALKANVSAIALDTHLLRQTLRDGGSIIW